MLLRHPARNLRPDAAFAVIIRHSLCGQGNMLVLNI